MMSISKADNDTTENVCKTYAPAVAEGTSSHNLGDIQWKFLLGSSGAYEIKHDNDIIHDFLCP